MTEAERKQKLQRDLDTWKMQELQKRKPSFFDFITDVFIGTIGQNAQLNRIGRHLRGNSRSKK